MKVELYIDGRQYADSHVLTEVLNNAARGIATIVKLEPNEDTLRDFQADDDVIARWMEQVVEIRISETN